MTKHNFHLPLKSNRISRVWLCFHGHPHIRTQRPIELPERSGWVS